jgi:hypothetical protein
MNISPSMQTSTDEDVQVKAPLIADLLNMWRMEFIIRNDIEAVDLSYRCKPIDAHKSPEHMGKERENLDFYIKTEVGYPSKRLIFSFQKISPEILSHLTDADLRYLIDFEDEHVLRGHFELIYPAPETIADYLPCIEPTYANLLLTAWTSLSAKEREIGIERVKSMAAMSAHLSEEGFVDNDSTADETETEDIGIIENVAV